MNGAPSYKGTGAPWRGAIRCQTLDLWSCPLTRANSEEVPAKKKGLFAGPTIKLWRQSDLGGYQVRHQSLRDRGLTCWRGVSGQETVPVG